MMRSNKVYGKLMGLIVVFVLCLIPFANSVIYISNITDLQKIGTDYPANGEYELTQNIDASETINWNNGEGFVPLCPYTNPFIGKFDGKGFKITNLYINRPNDVMGTGLFQAVGSDGVTGVEIKNLGLENVNITGKNRVGALASDVWEADISNCYVTGTVSGYQIVGGLIAGYHGGNLTKCYFVGTVSGESSVGGLLSNNGGNMSKCFSYGAINSIYGGGGLVSSTSSREGVTYGTIQDSFSACSVHGSSPTGVVSAGLVGYLWGDSKVQRCYAVGHLYGYWQQDLNRLGTHGLVGYIEPGVIVSDSYWDIDSTGASTSKAGVGKTTAEMKQQSTFANWDFSNVWTMQPGSCYPTLIGLPNPYLTTVPNVVGNTQSSAENAIVSARLKVGNITQTCNNSVPAGVVISQSPVQGTEVCEQHPIDLTISTGNCPVSNPNIVGNPPQAHYTAGGTLTLRVEYEGGVGEVNFQWYYSPQQPTKIGEPIPGANSDTLVIPNLQPSHTGWYWCVISDDVNVVQTEPIFIQVEPGISVYTYFTLILCVVMLIAKVIRKRTVYY